MSTSWSSSGCTMTEPFPLGTELGLDDCRGLVLLLPIPDVSAQANSRRLSLLDLFWEGEWVAKFAPGTNIVGGTCCCICWEINKIVIITFTLREKTSTLRESPCNTILLVIKVEVEEQ